MMAEVPTVRLVSRTDPSDCAVVNVDDVPLFLDRYYGPGEQPERVDDPIADPMESIEAPVAAPEDETQHTYARGRRSRAAREI